MQKYARYIDPENAKAWDELMTPKADGLILRKISSEFKFVSDEFLSFTPAIGFSNIGLVLEGSLLVMLSRQWFEAAAYTEVHYFQPSNIKR